MADQQNQTPEPTVLVVEKKPARFKTFILNHPRATAVAALGITVAGVVAAVKIGKKNKAEISALSSDEELQELVQLETAETA